MDALKAAWMVAKTVVKRDWTRAGLLVAKMVELKAAGKVALMVAKLELQLVD